MTPPTDNQLDRLVEDHQLIQRKVFLFSFFVAFLAFFYDSFVGGILLLSSLIHFVGESSTSFIDFFQWMLLYSVLFAFIWSIIAYFNFRGRKLVFSVTALGYVSLLMLYCCLNNDYNHVTWYGVFLPLFSFVSYSLYTIITILTSRFFVPERRGKLIGGAACFALVIAALFELAFIGSEFDNDKARLSLMVVFAVFVIISLLLLLNYFDLKPRGTDLVTNPKPKLEFSSFKDMNLFLSVSAASLTFIGSGFLHSIELHYIPEVTLDHRAYAYLIAGFIIFIVAFLSDYLGRFIILVSASVFTLGSALAAIYSFIDYVIIAFELAGYYLLIIYVLLQLADFISQKIVLVSGIGWGMKSSFSLVFILKDNLSMLLYLI